MTERLDLIQMGLMFGPMGMIVGFIGNFIMDIIEEDELWEDWSMFYQRTYSIWWD